MIESASKGVVELLCSINLLELMRRGWVELVVEWPEVVELASKLAKGVELSEVDRSWLKELALTMFSLYLYTILIIIFVNKYKL